MHGSVPFQKRFASLNGVSQHCVFHLCDAALQKVLDGIRCLMSHFEDEGKDCYLLNQFYRKLLQKFLSAFSVIF